MSDLPEVTPEVAAVIRRYLENGGTWPPLPALATGIANTQTGTSPSAGSNVFGSLSGGHAMLPPREPTDERTLARSMQDYLDDVTAVQGPPDPFPARMSAANWSLTDRIRHLIQDALMAGGAKPYEAGSLAGGITGLVGLTPAGVPMAADDVGRAIERGDIAGAGIAALGLLPVVGRLTKPARSIGRSAVSAAEREARPISYGKPADANNLAKSVAMRDPRALPQRPPQSDYLQGVPVDASGRVTHTIEGVPIGPRDTVAGRLVGGDAPDAALTPEGFEQAGTRLTGKHTQIVPENSLPGEGTSGMYRPSTRERFVAQELDKPSAGRVLQHETGHSFGYVPIETQRIIHDALIDRAYANPKVENELRFVYNDLNNPDLARIREKTGDPNWLPPTYDMDGWRKSTPRTRAAQPFTHFGPEDRGYGGESVNHELTAEAFRAYGANPNYFKTVAPNLAKAIREIWNTHPVASKVLKFNSVVGAAGAPAAWHALGDEQRETDEDRSVFR